MSRSKKMHRRISQSDLHGSVIEWLNRTSNGSKLELISSLELLKKKLDKMQEKGGYAMVTCEDNDVTIYRI